MTQVNLRGVPETALITLIARAEDAASAKPFLNDQLSLELRRQIEIPDESKFKMGFLSYHGILARLSVMDREVKAFLATHPSAVVVSLGAGLDTRFWRIDDGSCQWFDVDLPDIIALRQELLPAHPRVQHWAYSALDPAWMKALPLTPETPLLILSEGMVMYLPVSDVTKMLNAMCDAFDHFTLHLDMVSLGVAKMKQTDVVKRMDLDAVYHWGTKDGKEVVAMAPRLRLVDFVSFDDALQVQLHGWQWLLFRVIRYANMNNHLGIYEYQAP